MLSDIVCQLSSQRQPVEVARGKPNALQMLRFYCQASVPRDVFPPTPPGPEGSNGNGLLRVQWVAGAWLINPAQYSHKQLICSHKVNLELVAKLEFPGSLRTISFPYIRLENCTE
jgi:hypothetical protein